MATTTTTVTSPYSSTNFHSIEDLYPAATKFKDLKGPEWVYEVAKPLLVKHGLNKTFGVGMLHRHFDIDADQILVEFNNITLPWKSKIAIDGEPGTKKIQATSWKLVPKRSEAADGTSGLDAGADFAWMPYEFSYDPTVGLVNEDNNPVGPDPDGAPVDLNDSKYRAFLTEYGTAIQEAGLEQVVGLRQFPGLHFRGGLERTEGKANIWLNPDQVRSTYTPRRYAPPL